MADGKPCRATVDGRMRVASSDRTQMRDDRPTLRLLRQWMLRNEYSINMLLCMVCCMKIAIALHVAQAQHHGSR